MIRQVVKHVPAELLQEDLERYRRRALELGAADAAIIRASDVPVDERVRAKCLYPVCNLFGTSINCPPYVPDPEFVRRLVSRYEHAILFRMRVPPRILERIPTKLGKPTKVRPVLNEIVSRIEFEAFYDGHYLALGLASGSCRLLYCPSVECQALVKGQPCRQPLRARPSIEALSIDAFKMAVEQDWDIYPVGISASPSDVPCLNWVGLVLIC